MEDPEIEDQQLLGRKLRDALDEAWTKANAALDEIGGSSKDSDMTVWLAAEAVEYTCLLYSLTYGLEDVDPPLKQTKGLDYVALVKESVEALKLVRNQASTKHEKTYEILRNAANELRTVHLSRIKKSGRSS